MIRVVIFFGMCGLVGPILWSLYGGLSASDFLLEFVGVVWPTWVLGAFQYTVSPIVLTIITVGGNIIVYSIFGAALSANASLYWKAAIGMLAFLGWWQLNALVNRFYWGFAAAIGFLIVLIVVSMWLERIGHDSSS